MRIYAPANHPQPGYLLRYMPAQGWPGFGTEDNAATCLEVGTLVLTPEGPRPIETLRIGEPVWAWDPAVPDLVVTRVTALDPVHTEAVWEVACEGGHLRATAFHRVRVERLFPGWTWQGWVDCRTVQPGDILLSPTGKRLTVTAVHPVGLRPVMNLTTAPRHNFLVAGGPFIVADAQDPFLVDPESFALY
jgi:hypothetical protein